MNIRHIYDVLSTLFLSVRMKPWPITLCVVLLASVVAGQERRSTASELVRASEFGNVQRISELLRAGVSPNASDGFETPLIAASRTGQVLAVKRLLAAKADVAKRDVNHFTAIQAAAEGNHVEVVKLLIAVPHAERNALGREALSFASQFGYLSVVDTLLAAGIPPDPRALDAALLFDGSEDLGYKKGSNFEVVKRLLAAGVSIEGKDQNGFTPLMYAAAGRNEEAIAFLLKQGAAVDSRSNCSVTPLMVAALDGFNDGINLLLAAGANANAVTESGLSPLMFASVKGQLPVIQRLLSAGANAKLRDEDGWGALDWADHGDETSDTSATALRKAGAVLRQNYASKEAVSAVEGDLVDDVRRSLADGTSPVAETFNGNQLLHVAANSGALNVTMLLLRAGADVNARSNLRPFGLAYIASGESRILFEGLAETCGRDLRSREGSTPLMDAARSNHIAVAAELLGARARVNDVADGNTALSVSIQNGSVDVIRLLLDAGAVVDTRDREGLTPLMNAAFSSRLEVVQLLLARGADWRIKDKEGHDAIWWGRHSKEVTQLLVNKARQAGNIKK